MCNLTLIFSAIAALSSIDDARIVSFLRLALTENLRINWHTNL